MRVWSLFRLALAPFTSSLCITYLFPVSLPSGGGLDRSSRYGLLIGGSGEKKREEGQGPATLHEVWDWNREGLG